MKIKIKHIRKTLKCIKLTDKEYWLMHQLNHNILNYIPLLHQGTTSDQCTKLYIHTNFKY